MVFFEVCLFCGIVGTAAGRELGGRLGSSGVSSCQLCSDDLDDLFFTDWLGRIFITACVDAFLAIAVHRVGG